MEELEVCRVCLTRDVGLRLIANTHLQEVYESLTLLPLETKDRPSQVCYICCAALQNCHRLRQRCLRTEELLTQHVIQLVNIKECSFAPRLRVVRPVLLSMVDEIHQIEISDTDDDTTGQWDDITIEEEEIGTENIQMKIEDSILDDIVAGQSSQPADIVRPKIHKEVDGNMKRNDIETGTSVVKKRHLAPQNNSTEITYTNEQTKAETETENVDEDTLIKINETTDKSVTFHQLTDNEVTSIHDGNNRRSKRIIKTPILRALLECHARKHTGEKLFQCKRCKKFFFSESLLKEHMHKHTLKPKYTCDFCNRSYLHKINLETHIRAHDSEQYKCNKCDKYYYRKAKLKSHKCIKSDKRKHIKSDEHKFFKSDIHKYIKSVEHKCIKSDKRKHIKSVEHKCIKSDKCITVCKLCNKSVMSYHFKKHILVHTGEKLHMCHVCSKCFLLPLYLKRHMRLHTGEKPYMCDVCNKCFSFKEALRNHTRMHTGEKPYMCNVCKRRFTFLKHLKRHRFVHSGEKPFVCEECGKRFTQNSNLKSHLRTHTGEKPYSCDVCNTCFSHSSSLKSHMLKHNKNK